MSHHDSTAAPYGPPDTPTATPVADQATAPALDPLSAILAAILETNRLLAILVSQNASAATRQDPRTYQTVADGKRS